MRITRRLLLPLFAAGVVAAGRARAQTAGQSSAAAAVQTSAWESERAVGDPSAKVTVEEWFSLTCTHCAHFAQETFPQIENELVKSGKVRWVFRDFPLDRVALEAAMVARALPPDRYATFVLALFASQDRWAFAQGVDPAEEIWKLAALDGMSRPIFDAAIGDTALQDWILAQQAAAEKKYGIDATPSFVINGKMTSGEMSYGDFVKLLPDVS